MIKAIIDTCFIERFNKDSKSLMDFEILMKEAGLDLLIHEYIYENELSMFSYANQIIEHSICRVIEYKDFLSDDWLKEQYKGYFLEIYNEFYNRLRGMNSFKAEKMKELDESTDIFTYRSSGSSLGDVHMIIMALFLDVPIILSEDSDMALIYDIAKRKINSGNRELEVYRINDVIEYIKANGSQLLSGKELRRIRRAYSS